MNNLQEDSILWEDDWGHEYDEDEDFYTFLV